MILDAIHHLSYGADGTRAVGAIDQHVAGKPEDKTEEGQPQQTLLAYRHHARHDGTGHGKNVEVALVVADVNRRAERLDLVRYGYLDLEPEQRANRMVHAGEYKDVVGMTWTHQTEQQTEHEPEDEQQG